MRARLYAMACKAIIAATSVAIVFVWFWLPEDNRHKGDWGFWLSGIAPWTVLAYFALRGVGMFSSAGRRRETDGTREVRGKLALATAISGAVVMGCYLHLIWTGAFPYRRALFLAICGFMLFYANYQGKLRPNGPFGLRTPWNKMDPANWYATHRFAAKTLTVAGLLALIPALLGAGVHWLLAAVFGAQGLNYAYSYWYSRRHPRLPYERRDAGGTA